MKSELCEISERKLPSQRLRRLRKQEYLRLLLKETRLSSSDFMYPANIIITSAKDAARWLEEADQ